MAIYNKIRTFFTRKFLNIFFIIIIKIYCSCISPFISSKCRYYPTCSEYALKAFKTHIIPKSLYLITLRLLRCHPFYKKNYYDPVPLFKTIEGLKKNNER